MSSTGHFGPDPEFCEEYGYGLGRPDGIFVLKYRSTGLLEVAESRQDFLHQLYWSPDGILSTLTGLNAQFVGAGEAFWARRAVTHEVRAPLRQTVYRVCLRQVSPLLDGLHAGAVSLSPEAARLIQLIARPGCGEADALAARAGIMTGVGASTRAFVGHHASGPGYAMTVARALSHDPGDATALAEWAAELRVSVKTLQRDFVREFGMPYSRWRTRLRLRAARALLAESHQVTKVAHRVGYASPSAFILAFTKEYGHTPGTIGRQPDPALSTLHRPAAP